MRNLITLTLSIISLQLNAQSSIDSHDPVWSPNGNRIAFYSNLDGDFEIYVMNRDGSDLVQLTHNDIYDGSPAWSPDGNSLLFSSKIEDNFELFTYNFSTREVQELIKTKGNEHAASWSPDGKKIVFESNIDGAEDIFLMQSDGSGIHNITNNQSNDFRPSWSNDESLIYFQSKRSGKYQIYSLKLNSSEEPKRLFADDFHQTSPSSMNTLNKILYVLHKDEGSNIFLLDLDTNISIKITNDIGEITAPSFSPNDKEILFTLTTNKITEIYTLNFLSEEISQLTKFNK